LSIAGSETSETVPPSGVPVFVRYLDIVVIVAFLPFAVLTGLPLLGYAVGGGVWTLQRLLGAALDRHTASAADPRRGAYKQLAGVLGRVWLMGLTILAVGLLGERRDGLTAAVLVFVAFTIYLALSLILRPQRKSSS
jgi:hypothetical protein